MSLIAVEGTYEDGKIELSELPAGVKKARVVVTFLPPPDFESQALEQAEKQAAADRMIARMKAGIDFGPGKFNRAEIYEEREAARQRAFARMEAGLDLGGEKFDRDEIYEERMKELERRRQQP